jgi:hypothetical protein
MNGAVAEPERRRPFKGTNQGKYISMLAPV